MKRLCWATLWAICHASTLKAAEYNFVADGKIEQKTEISVNIRRVEINTSGLKLDRDICINATLSSHRKRYKKIKPGFYNVKGYLIDYYQWARNVGDINAMTTRSQNICGNSLYLIIYRLKPIRK